MKHITKSIPVQEIDWFTLRDNFDVLPDTKILVLNAIGLWGNIDINIINSELFYNNPRNKKLIYDYSEILPETLENIQYKKQDMVIICILPVHAKTIHYEKMPPQVEIFESIFHMNRWICYDDKKWWVFDPNDKKTTVSIIHK